jgi:DNA-binding CsgD family transcriptional regulator
MLTVRARLFKDSSRIRDLMAMLDCNPAPMMAVNAQGRLVHANAAAEALFAEGSLIRLVGGHLGAANPAADLRVAHAISRAADPAAPEADFVALSHASGHLELTFAPVQDRGTGLVLVTGRDPDAHMRNALQPAAGGERLAPRELMVARLVGRGLRNREIAAQMGLTEGTVKVYLHNVFAKVGVTTRTELALLIGPQ